MREKLKTALATFLLLVMATLATLFLYQCSRTVAKMVADDLTKVIR